METLRRFAFAAFLAVCCAASLRADSAQDLLRQGNAAYTAAKFNDAVTAYESAQSAGLHHWILSYNLGNAYYKAGQLGKAVVNYERAFRRHSSDRDVIYNLALASAKAGDPRLPGSGLLALFWRLFYALTIDALAVVSSILFIALCVALCALLLGRAAAHGDKIGALAVLVALSGLWFGVRVYLAGQPTAIVTASVADVRSGPNLSYPANFTVPEGHSVLLLDEQEPVSGWVEIGVPSQGLKGWVPSNAVEAV
jgi:hypothetical protein